LSKLTKNKRRKRIKNSNLLNLMKI